MQELYKTFNEEKDKVINASDVNKDILLSLENEEWKIKTDLELKQKLYEDRHDKAKAKVVSEMRKIEEAWQDIEENEKQIRELECGNMDPKLKASLLQRRTHINEAKELLLDEQKLVSENNKKLLDDLKTEQQQLNFEKLEISRHFQNKKRNALSSMSSRLLQINDDIVNKKREADVKEKNLNDLEKELENLEGVLNISTESCIKQQKDIELKKLQKQEERDLFEKEFALQISKLEAQISRLDADLQMSTDNLRKTMMYVEITYFLRFISFVYIFFSFFLKINNK